LFSGSPESQNLKEAEMVDKKIGERSEKKGPRAFAWRTENTCACLTAHKQGKPGKHQGPVNAGGKKERQRTVAIN